MNTINLQRGSTPEIPARDSSLVAKGERLPGFHIDSKDVLQQLQANLTLLEDKCGRLGFVMNEIRSAIRK